VIRPVKICGSTISISLILEDPGKPGLIPEKLASEQKSKVVEIVVRAQFVTEH